MNLKDYAREILEGESLNSKLLVIPKLENIFEGQNKKEYTCPLKPGRAGRISFSSKQMRFPKINSFIEAEKRSMALHFFANHELLAIEMMAAFILIYPDDDNTLKLKKGVLSSLKDEQKHLKLYIDRMKELSGVEFGDFPLSDFFWRQMKVLKDPAQFLSFMSMTIESANLDFALFYKNIFEEYGDSKTSKILEIVLNDEIKHVGLGYSWLKRWSGDQDTWDYYNSLLPDRLTPARAKGIIFNDDARRKAGIDEDFILRLKNFRSDFLVTNRKSWNKDHI
ncbi:MAG: DUF455 family protein [Bdellovibrionota bacterium]|nr:DUF455 family protein [Bdellovibrionota bacterium]|tara:strand:- start:1335 stop:2174 length:840 start_codon:yes stop_codon:yes gene_type:complete